MDYTIYTSVKNEFAKSPNTCDLFKLLSIETWKRMEYAYLKPGVKIYETTITQNLIFTINAYNDQYPLNIEVWEAVDENTNGNDFELIVQFPKDGIEFYAPIQAKKVYKNGAYTSMNHGDQIVSLRNYAASKGAIPFYLLYNFAPSPIREGVTLSLPMEWTGCSLITAEYLHDNYYNKRTVRKRDGTRKQAWKVPKFYDLNPFPAFPWHHLVCPGNANALLKYFQNIGIAKDVNIDNIKSNKSGFFPIETFKDKSGWKDIKDMVVPPNDGIERSDNQIVYYKGGSIDLFDKDDNKKVIYHEYEKEYPKFSPKSRIIISKE